jgi:hypothetical protein
MPRKSPARKAAVKKVQGAANKKQPMSGVLLVTAIIRPQNFPGSLNHNPALVTPAFSAISQARELRVPYVGPIGTSAPVHTFSLLSAWQEGRDVHIARDLWLNPAVQAELADKFVLLRYDHHTACLACDTVHIMAAAGTCTTGRTATGPVSSCVQLACNPISSFLPLRHISSSIPATAHCSTSRDGQTLCSCV